MRDGFLNLSGHGLKNQIMFKRISLNNFKIFSSRVPLEMEKFTIMYGKNGRGKSSVIQSLLLLTQSLNENNGTLNYLSINGPLTELGSFEDIRNRYSDANKPIGFEIENDLGEVLSLEFSRVPDKPTIGKLVSLHVGGKSYVSENEMEGDIEGRERVDSNGPIILPQSDIRSYSSLKSLSYVSAGRLGPRNFEERKDFPAQFDLDSKGEWIINSLASQTSDFVDRLSQELSLILSGATIRIFNNDKTPDRIDLFIDSSNSDHDGFRPKNVGFGYSYVLPIIYRTMIAAKGSTIVVENPEAHLYPGAQSRLMDFLVKYAVRNNLQVILETHSDHIINGLRLAVKEGRAFPNDCSILFFDRDEDDRLAPQVTPIRIDSRGALSYQPRDFMDEWTRQMLALL